jgi:hypothetical protein
MKKSRTGLAVCMLLFTLIAHAQSVKSDYDTRVDFKKFKTYAWLAQGDSVLNRHRADKAFGDYITYYAGQELKSRGMRMDTLRPDAIFMFFTNVQEVTTYSQSPSLSVGVGVGGPGYYAYGGVPVAGGNITAHTTEDGLLKFVMFDAQTGDEVWTGMMEKEFKTSTDVAVMLGEVIPKIFKKYPVKK